MDTDNNSSIDKSMPVFPISAAAKLVGISVHTLRMYEKEGLIIPFKESGHNRLYSYTDVERLHCIRGAIKEKKFSIPAIKTMFSFIPCWKLVKCSEKDRQNCEAYNGIEKPCWQYNHKNNMCAAMNCRDCPVYNNFTHCEDIKDQINTFLRES